MWPRSWRRESQSGTWPLTCPRCCRRWRPRCRCGGCGWARAMARARAGGPGDGWTGGCGNGGAREQEGCARAAPTTDACCACPPLASPQRYGRKAVRSAYDAISTAVEEAPGLVSQPPLAALILPPLYRKLDTLMDGDRELLPLMECLTAGARAAGSGGALMGADWVVGTPAADGSAALHPAAASPITHRASLPAPRSGGQDGRRQRGLRRALLLPLHRAGGAHGAGGWRGSRVKGRGVEGAGLAAPRPLACRLTPPPRLPPPRSGLPAPGRLQRRR